MKILILFQLIIRNVNTKDPMLTTKRSKSSKRRPQVVVNQFPGSQTVYSKQRVVPGHKSYSEIVKGIPSKCKVKIFSDSIPKGIRLREFNRLLKNGNAKLLCFPGVNSKQLLHYLDINLDDCQTDTVILHVGVNDILQDQTSQGVENLVNNIKCMAQKCYSYGVTNIFISGLVYTTRIDLHMLEEIHKKLVNLCPQLNLHYIDNTNIRSVHLFKDGLHLLGSGKSILANNFICSLNSFLYDIHQTNVLI